MNIRHLSLYYQILFLLLLLFELTIWYLTFRFILSITCNWYAWHLAYCLYHLLRACRHVFILSNLLGFLEFSFLLQTHLRFYYALDSLWSNLFLLFLFLFQLFIFLIFNFIHNIIYFLSFYDRHFKFLLY